MGLYADGDREWSGVSSALVTARLQVTGFVCAVIAVVITAIGLLAWRPLLWADLLVLGVLGLACWLVPRQVSAMSYVEDPEELLIRRGRIFRTLISVPYGRLQYVDLESGPLSRHHGIAGLQLHTASPNSDAHIKGLPQELAEELRERLTARGESQRAGL